MNASLLVELFTEELPPKALKQLGDAFASAIQDGLSRAGLKDQGATGTKVFATPRRLAVLIPDVKPQALDRSESKKLMPTKVAFDADGKPTPALLKRLEKEGARAEGLSRAMEGNAEYAFLNQTIPGATLAAGLQIALDEAIAKLPIPKVMGYQLADGTTTVSFVRPAHGLLALHGADVLLKPETAPERCLKSTHHIVIEAQVGAFRIRESAAAVLSAAAAASTHPLAKGGGLEGKADRAGGQCIRAQPSA